MSDDTTTPDETEISGAVLSDGVYTLIAADFDDTDTAIEAYEALKAVEKTGAVEIEAVVVVTRDDDGKLVVQKVTDHSTRAGLGWGAFGGAVLGIIFPPSIIASAIVFGAAGAAVGKAREVHHRKELADDLRDAIDPGHSGILALVSDPAAVELAKALDKADRIVSKGIDKAAALDMKAAAKEIEAEQKADAKDA